MGRFGIAHLAWFMLVVGLLTSPPTAAGQLDSLAWLEGTWQRETRRGTAYETWRLVGERTFEGEGWRRTESGGRRIGEQLLQVERGGAVFYIANPTENAEPTPFRLTQSGENTAVFENPAHDFPQKIGYDLDPATDALMAWVEGPGEDGEPRRIEFPFTRVVAQETLEKTNPAAIVKALASAFNAHDVDAMLALVTDDVEWLSVDGRQVAVEAAGKETLRQGMAGYFESCPSCRSELESLTATESRVSTVERASWDSADGPTSQRSLAVYELLGDRIRRVYYFPSEP